MFDGDEMNLHLPQSLEAQVELEEIAAIPNHIITPRHAKPLIGVYQDTLVGSYRLTRPGVDFTKREFMNLMMWNPRFDGAMPEARAAGGKRYTGQQILSSMLPALNIEMGNKAFDGEKDTKESNNYIRIVQGDIKQGIVDDDIYMKPGKGIIHTTYNDYGPKDTTQLLDSLQNTIESFLVMNGFSVGISDLVADEDTKRSIDEVIQAQKKQVENIILQVHTDLFDNNTGKTNQQEFEDQVFGALNQATEAAGKAGKKSLSTENRLLAMVNSGSKGNTTNVAQMIACLGQQAIEGKRIQYGFTDRTLPHYKKYDDGAEARGFIESSFIRGLTPQEFYFHAMSGREGLIDTAVKSVTGDTPVVVLEGGKTRCVPIGEWIDRKIDGAPAGTVEHYEERDMELLRLKSPVYIPTADEDGCVSWGEITAITRHDPGKELYEIKTLGGKSVIVTESKSLLIWNAETRKFEQMSTPDVRPGHYVPVTQELAVPPVLNKAIDVADYLPKTEYVYGTDYITAREAVAGAMAGREHIPAGWWKENNGKLFTLPYDSKARFQRALVRSEVANIQAGCVYPFHATREHGRVPDMLPLNRENGQFIGLFLAEGNACVDSGYVQITNNNPTIRNFAKSWFAAHGIKTSEEEKINHIGGKSSCVRGYSTVLAKFLTALVGHTAYAKRVPAEAFGAPEEFIVGLIDGYFSGDGTVSHNSVEASSASAALIDGISMLATRLGIFGKVSQVQLASNNLSTEKIAPTYRLSIRAQWAAVFASKISLMDEEKNVRLVMIAPSEEHRNFPTQNNVVLDKIVEIRTVDVAKYPKVYDLTVPSTLNFGLANGLHVVDTAETGYIQRKLIKAMEDHVVQHDGTVRDSNMNILQFHYGEDGIMATKIEGQALPLGKMSQDDIRREFSMEAVDWSTVLEDGTNRTADEDAIASYVENILEDQRMLVEDVFQGNALESGTVSAPVNLARMILNTKVRFGLKPDQRTDLVPGHVLEGIQRIINRTQSYNRIWTALLRFHLAPHKIIVKERFSRNAFDALCELIVVSHMRSWVQPGEQVGIVAAQSIGEPSTQMTLNSVDGETEIMIACDGKIMMPTIAEFIHSYEAIADKSRIQRHANDQIYIDMKDDGHDWHAISCDENGKMVWTKLEAITHHPVVNADGSDTILEVELESGRKVKATKALSFLTRKGDKVADIAGVDLRVGDVLPLALDLAIPAIGEIDTVSLRGQSITLDAEFGSHVGNYLAGNSKSIELESIFGNQLPTWVFQAPTPFVKSLVGAYVSHVGIVSDDNHISMTSANKRMLSDMSTLLMTRCGAYSTLSTTADGYHTLRIASHYITGLMNSQCSVLFPKEQTTEQVFWDKIVSISECRPSGSGRVYDLTVESTRNFMTGDAIVMKDTFHLAGVASKSNVTRGVPRLNELLKVTKNPKATSLTIYLKPEYYTSKDKAREVVQDLELTLLRDITNKLAIYWDPKDDSTVIEEDRALLEFYRAFSAMRAIEEDFDPESEAQNTTKWVLRLELNKETMFNKNISMADVVFAIKSRGFSTDIIYSDYNSDKLVMRIRVKPDAKTTASALDEFTNLKKFQNSLLNTTVIRGVPGIKAVTFRNDKSKVALTEGKYEPVTQYILDTDGSNYVRVMNHPAVDANRLYTTNIHDITDILGLEAARAILYNELATLFESVSVNYRHLGMLCDVITRTGRMMSIDRYGINKNDIGPLAKASFEETEKIMLKAALFGEVDPVTGVSANIMTGQPIRGGTAFSQILLDEAALMKLSEGMTVDEEETEEDGDISDLLEGGINIADPCSAAQFQMNMSMPPLVSALEEPDVGINLIET